MALTEEPIIQLQELGTGRCVRLQPSRQLWVRFGSGDNTRGGPATSNLHPQRTIAHPSMLLSTSDPLSVRRMKCYVCHKTAQQNHRRAAQNSCCGRSGKVLGDWHGGKALTVILQHCHGHKLAVNA